MSKNLTRTGLVVVVLSLLAAACGTSNESGSEFADEFNAIVKKDLSYSFTGFQTPAAAIEAADLIVSGTITDVNEGMQIIRPNTRGSCADQAAVEAAEIAKGEPAGECIDSDEVTFARYVSVSLDVKTVIAGDSAKPGTELIIQLEVPILSGGRLLDVAPRGDAVFILDNANGWTPTDDARFVWPDGKLPDATIFIPYADGVWFTGTDTPTSPYADLGDLEIRWATEFDTVADIEATLLAATN